MSKGWTVVYPHDYPEDLVSLRGDNAMVLRSVEGDEARYIVLMPSALYTMLFEMVIWAETHNIDMYEYSNAIGYPFNYGNSRVTVITKDSEGSLFVSNRERFDRSSDYAYGIIRRPTGWTVHS